MQYMQEHIVTLENLCLSVSWPEIEDIMASKHALNVPLLGFKNVGPQRLRGGKGKLLKIAQVRGKMTHMRTSETPWEDQNVKSSPFVASLVLVRVRGFSGRNPQTPPALEFWIKPTRSLVSL